MADFVYLPARGRIVEIVTRMMLGADPAGLIWVVPVLAHSAADEDLVNADSLASCLALGVTEATGWYRQSFGGGDLGGLTINQPDGYIAALLPTVVWPGIPIGADTITDVIVCYAPDGSSDLALWSPLTQHDFEVEPNGLEIHATSNEFYHAT